ncbi:MAG TPA: HD domain-containing protein [Candidatus Gastranaerophilaceae bacterium]|nr:HD domain-containing protein [Candidatus Gastranaerophilaceae bacterium]
MTGLDVNSKLSLNTIHNTAFITVPKYKSSKISFASNFDDSFSFNNEIQQYLTPMAVNRMLSLNPKISEVLKSNNLPVKINTDELNNLVKTHLSKTRETLLGIYQHLDDKYRHAIDFESVQKASMLHDIGKVLIPAKLLNKPQALSLNEFNIIKLHSELGYQMLKTTDLSPKVLDLVRYHHQNPFNTGYPKRTNSEVVDLNLQLLSVADSFSALIEKRPYKKALRINKALEIIHKKMKKGEVHPYLFKALVDYANESRNINGKIMDTEPVNRLSA